MKYKDPVINQPFPNLKFLSGKEPHRIFLSQDLTESKQVKAHGEKAKLGQQKKTPQKRNCFGLNQKDSAFFSMRCLHKTDFVGFF